MIECRHCHNVAGRAGEAVGARCPTCRMPLFEKDRQRPPVVDLGPCALHNENGAVAKCQRCGKMMCALCRTRWEEAYVCSTCLDGALKKGDANPRVVQGQFRRARSSVLLALLAWAVFVLARWLLTALFRESPERGTATFTLILFFSSMFLAIYAIGQAAACIRVRSQSTVLATVGFSLAGLELGVCLGMVVLNLWHH